MPNNVANKVFFECGEEKAKEIQTAVMFDPDPEKEEYTGIGTFDFNKLIPMPQSLMIEAGSETERGIELYLHAVNPATNDYGYKKMPESKFRALVKSLQKEAMFGGPASRLDQAAIEKYTMHSPFEKLAELGKTAAENMLKYGATTWYDWSIHNWGTKWNSYDPWKGEDNGLLFSTAWSAPHPIIKELSVRFPGVYFTHEWADEDLGSNCGRREYLNGECVGEFIPETNKESIEFATSVWGDTPEDYGLALNIPGTDYVHTTPFRHPLIELFGKPALFTPERLYNRDVPQGLYLYHIRDDGLGGFGALEQNVAVNHAGSVITKEPIDLGESGFIEFNDSNEPNFTGEDITLYSFLEGRFSLEQGDLTEDMILT